MIIGIFNPSIIILLKIYFYLTYLYESNFTSDLNHVNPSANEKVVLDLVIVGLGRNSQETLACRSLLRIFGISFHLIFKTYFNWKYPSKCIFILLWNHFNRTSNEYFINEILLGSLGCTPLLNS